MGNGALTSVGAAKRRHRKRGCHHIVGDPKKFTHMKGHKPGLEAHLRLKEAYSEP